MSLFRRMFSRKEAAVEVTELAASPYFDANWYLKAYPDVKAARADPAKHYIEHGARERRDPGPKFSTAEYFARHAELEATGENPVLHFMRVRGEGEEPPLPDYSDRTIELPEPEYVQPAKSKPKPLLPIRHGPLVDPDRDRELNELEAAADAESVARSQRSIDALVAALPVNEAATLADPVPAIFHFVYGFKSAGDIPFYGYMAIRSALSFNPGWRAYYYSMHEPAGPNWDRIKDYVTYIRIGDFDYFMNAKFHHYAHKADVVRLIVINKVGGVYLDLDTLTRRSFEGLRNEEFVMGVQASGPDSSSGMANAVMMGKPGARFSTIWIEQYGYFRSKGRDDLWDYHSVKMPVQMMSLAPDAIRVLDYRAFFYPLWHSVEAHLFTERAYDRFKDEFEDAYCFHLWNGASGPFLETLDDDFVRTSRSVYAEIARLVESTPLTPTEQVAPVRKLRRAKKGRATVAPADAASAGPSGTEVAATAAGGASGARVAGRPRRKSGSVEVAAAAPVAGASVATPRRRKGGTSAAPAAAPELAPMSVDKRKPQRLGKAEAKPVRMEDVASAAVGRRAPAARSRSGSSKAAAKRKRRIAP
jgi:hypothetical protein